MKDHIIVVLELYLLLIDWLSFGEARGGRGDRLKLGVQDQGGGRMLDIAGQVEWRILKIGPFSWTLHVCPLGAGSK